MQSTWSRNIVVTLAAVAMLAVAAAAWAGPGRGFGQGRGGCGYAAADLTPEQQAALDKDTEAYREAMAPLGRELYAKQASLQAELAQTKIDRKKVDALAAEVADLRTRMDRQRLTYRADMAEKYGLVGGFGAGCQGGPGQGRGQNCAGPGQGRFQNSEGAGQGRFGGPGMGRFQNAGGPQRGI
jgi:zinc resistance-associated protein